MLRRFAPAGVRLAGVRYLKPSEDLKKLYTSDFENASYPTDIVPSDSSLFAKFLFKACEPKNAFDTVLKDFSTIEVASAKLPVFWQRTAEIEQISEFKGLSAPTTFTLVWMQNNGMLEQIPAVRAAFETYVNAQRKKTIAKIFVGEGSDAKNATTEGKKLAQELHKGLKELSGFSLDTKVIVDKEIVSGFAVELAGQYVNQAKGAEATIKASDDDVDYTNVPVPKFSKTVWADSIETEMLRSYIDKLAQYDAEEAKMGV